LQGKRKGGFEGGSRFKKKPLTPRTGGGGGGSVNAKAQTKKGGGRNEKVEIPDETENKQGTKKRR